MEDAAQKTAQIRAMANTLADHNVDPFNSTAICVALIQAGWPAKTIESVYEEVVLMATIRYVNDKKKAS